jgi:hypothetical protein
MLAHPFVKTVGVSDEEFADWVKHTVPGQVQSPQQDASKTLPGAVDENSLPAYAGPGSTAV